jgi:hypothetical protein
MLFLYLDESGDLGFDFITKKPSKFFTAAVLAVKGQDNNRALINAIKHTLKRKMGRRNLLGSEIKGSKVSQEVKNFFYNQVIMLDIKIYALTLNKKRVNQDLVHTKERLYNYVARMVLDRIDLNSAQQRVMLILDKSKGKPEIADFNAYIFSQLQGKINPKIPLDIVHRLSHETMGLQAADLFAWGIFRKYEKKDLEWFSVFREKVIFDDLYLP